MGDFVTFVGAGNILFEYAIDGASIAKSWTSYFTTLCGSFTYLRVELGDFVALIGAGNILLEYVVSGAAVARLTHGDTSNYSDFMPYGVRGVFSSAAVPFFAYVRFDVVSTMAEETKNPGKEIPIGLVGSMLIIVMLYCLMALTLCLMQNYKTIDRNAAYSVVFSKVGMNCAKYIVALGALERITTVLMVSVVGQARYLTHIARTHMFPPWFALVNEKTGTPINAMFIVAAVIAFFTGLEVLSNLLSICTLFILCLVAITLLLRRYHVSGSHSTTCEEIQCFG